MKLHLAKWKNPLSKKIFRALTRREIIFLCLTLVMSWGFINYDVKGRYFAKLGIPLSKLSKNPIAASSQIKIFITEIYILLLMVLSLSSPQALNRVKKIFSKKIIPSTMLAIIFFGFIRAGFDVQKNPILVVRNLAFVWYLIIPILVYVGGYSLTCLELYATLVAIIGTAYFIIVPIFSLFDGIITLYWIPFLGLYAALFVYYSAKKPTLKIISGMAWVIALSAGFTLGYQRTNLLGSLILIPFIYQDSANKLAFLKKSVILVFTTVLVHFSLQALVKTGAFPVVFDDKIKTSFDNPLKKAESNKAGLEVFRTQMWLDAADLFKKHPIVGIGFHDQVVYRVLYLLRPDGSTMFVPNDGVSWNYRDNVPIAGPHNSYLNALARMGIFGALFILLHVVATILLLKNGYLALFSLCYAQILYAQFNVGLEGPIRSFYLLIALGAALSLTLESGKQNQQNAQRS